VSQASINTAELKAFELAVPRRDEQTAIATALSDMDALIAQTEKLIEKKKAIKQGAMQELLKPKDGWVTKKLGELAVIYTGRKNNQDKIVEQIYNDMRKREEEKDADVKDLHSRITTISRELSDKVELTERRIMDEIKSLRNDIAEHNAKEDQDLKKILEWKWMAAGGIIVIAWLVSHIDLSVIGKLFG
jgi:restriction endonuclease S subunit